MAVQKTRVRLTNTATTEQTINERDGQITAFEVTELAPYTTYTAEAAVMVNGEWQPYTQPSTFTTAPLSQSSYPTSYDSDHRYYSISNPEGAYTEPATGTGYCDVYLTRGDGAETYVYWNFGNINIPTDATILSVSCTFRARIETAISSRIPIHTAQMYAGTSTPKGTAQTVAASATTYTLNFDPSDWTPAELNDAKLKIYAQRGTDYSNTSYSFRVYGAELVVEYA